MCTVWYDDEKREPVSPQNTGSSVRPDCRAPRQQEEEGHGEAVHHRLECGVAGSPNSVLLAG
jgi:hypothetical protein